MDNFKGGKFIVGTDIKADETKRIANELFRNQNENLRLSNETARTNAEIETKNSLFSQMGIISLIFVIIIILTAISLLAYEKATNNQSLVDLDNIRRLNLTDLTVYEKSNLNTLTLTGDTTSSGGATYNDGVSIDGGLSVGTKSNFYGDIRSYGGVSVQGGLSVDGTTNFYGGVSTDAGLSIGTTSNLYGEVIAHSGVSVIGGLSINGVANFYEEVHAYKGVSIDAGLSVGTTSNLYGNLKLLSDSSKIIFGANEEIEIVHSHDSGLKLKNTATGDGTPISLTLQSGEQEITASETIGSLNFQAPGESSEGDAILICAGIDAVSEETFDATTNSTKLSFKTAASETAAEKMSLSSTGVLTVSGGITSNGSVNVGADANGHDVTFFGATPGAQMLYDQSNDQLKLINASGSQEHLLNIDNNANVNALKIDSVNATSSTVHITANSLTSGNALHIESAANAITGTGRILNISHSGTTSTTGTLNEFSTSANDETVLTKFTANSLTTGNVVEISSTAITSGAPLKITGVAAKAAINIAAGNVHLNGGGIVKKVTLDTGGTGTITAAQLIAGFAYSGAAGGSVGLTFPGTDTVQTALAAMGVTSAAGTMLPPIPVFVSDSNNLTVTAGTGETVRGTAAINNETAIIYYVFTGAATADIIVVGNA